MLQLEFLSPSTDITCEPKSAGTDGERLSDA
jgi:hypothetical protein